MTGVADPYEPPLDPEVRLETVGRSIDENAADVVSYVEQAGLL
jgi:adenylylsulfate kinase-like enzyme